MRAEVQDLVKQGPLPRSTGGIPGIVPWQAALVRIKPPLTDEEAAAMVGLFPTQDDECFGLAWTMIHLVETAPHWPLQEHLHDKQNPWIARLRQAAHLD